MERLEGRELFAVDLSLATAPPAYELVESTHVAVELRGDVSNVVVQAYSFAPNLQSQSARERGDTVVLFDDGAHGDGAANDGVFGSRLPLLGRSGEHRVVIKASGTETSAQTFQRFLHYDLEVTAAALIVDGDSDLFAVSRRDGYMRHMGRLPDQMFDVAAAPDSRSLYVIEHRSMNDDFSFGRLILDPVNDTFTYTAIGDLAGRNINALEHDLIYAFSSSREQLLEIDLQTSRINRSRNLDHPLLGEIFGATTLEIGGDSVAARVNGTWISLTPNQGQLVRESVGGWSDVVTWHDLQPADVDGDGNLDWVGRAGNGRWWVARAESDGFVNERWGAMGTAGCLGGCPGRRL